MINYCNNSWPQKAFLIDCLFSRAKNYLHMSNPLSTVSLLLILLLTINPVNSFTQEKGDNSYVLAWDDVLALKVISASMKEEKLVDAPSNITIITKEMIENRGYRSFVEVAQDVPGFDFLMFEEGGGVFTTFSMNRGIGGQGNPRILVLVDNIPQNFINNLWSVHWTFEQIFCDLDRIEIIHGPGSVLYGGQAFTGVVHFITKKKYDGVYVKGGYGSNNEVDVQALVGKKLSDDFHLTLSLRGYHTDGDAGNERYDPGNYFPDTYIPPPPKDRPIGSVPPVEKNIPAEYNRMDSYSLRMKLTGKNTETGFSFWSLDRALSSFALGYLNFPQNTRNSHQMNGMHLYTKNSYQISDKFILESNLVARALWHHQIENEDNVVPPVDSSGQFFSSAGYQAIIDERLNYEINKNSNIIIGGRAQFNILAQSDEMINKLVSNTNESPSSMNSKTEYAFYSLWNNQINKYLAYSVGTRVDFGSDLELNHSPRVSLIIKPIKKINFKLIYGHAFRQPDTEGEFSTQTKENATRPTKLIAKLNTEKINTSELEINFLPDKRFKIKGNLFYSNMYDLIKYDADSAGLVGRIAYNKAKYKVFGTSISANILILKNFSVFSNYMYTQGKEEDEEGENWGDIDKVARHKLNIGINCHFFQKKLNLNLRTNIVGQRKANSENYWLQQYKNGYAPAYNKLNLTISYRGFKRLQPQLIIRNILNEQYYGIGRDEGSMEPFEGSAFNGNIQEDLLTPYHPQPGRTITFLLKFEL